MQISQFEVSAHQQYSLVLHCCLPRHGFPKPVFDEVSMLVAVPTCKPLAEGKKPRGESCFCKRNLAEVYVTILIKLAQDRVPRNAPAAGF